MLDISVDFETYCSPPSSAPHRRQMGIVLGRPERDTGAACTTSTAGPALSDEP